MISLAWLVFWLCWCHFFFDLLVSNVKKSFMEPKGVVWMDSIPEYHPFSELRVHTITLDIQCVLKLSVLWWMPGVPVVFFKYNNFQFSNTFLSFPNNTKRGPKGWKDSQFCSTSLIKLAMSHVYSEDLPSGVPSFLLPRERERAHYDNNLNRTHPDLLISKRIETHTQG